MKEIGLEQKMRSYATKSDFVNFLKPKGELVRKMDFETINKNLLKVNHYSHNNLQNYCVK